MTEIAQVDHLGTVHARNAPTDRETPLYEFRERVHAELAAFLSARATEIDVDAPEAGDLVDVAMRFVSSGKYLRSTFAYLGWLSQADASSAALRAAASLELFHAFALIQDDIMDESTLRRGHPTAHRILATSHAEREPAQADRRFGESAATLLADLCLVWAERMLRTSGLATENLERAGACYDNMRQELAVGQYLDLLNTNRNTPGLADVLRVARLKSARYTVTRPLLLGASLAGTDQELCGALEHYGESIGEAFQMRDDVLGAFGDPAVTGKPIRDDLRHGKVTTVVALALEMADSGQRHRLRHLLDEASAQSGDDDSIRKLITETGALEQIETMINERVRCGMQALDGTALSGRIHTELDRMALACVDRTQ